MPPLVHIQNMLQKNNLNSVKTKIGNVDEDYSIFFFQLCGLSDSDLRERTVEELDIAFDNIAEKHYKEAEVKGQILSQQNRQLPNQSI